MTTIPALLAGLALAVPPDLTNDGVVGQPDLTYVLASWGPCPADKPCPADLNGDGAVNAGDVAVVLSAWGQTVDGPAPPPPPPPEEGPTDPTPPASTEDGPWPVWTETISGERWLFGYANFPPALVGIPVGNIKYLMATPRVELDGSTTWLTKVQVETGLYDAGFVVVADPRDVVEAMR